MISMNHYAQSLQQMDCLTTLIPLDSRHPEEKDPLNESHNAVEGALPQPFQLDDQGWPHCHCLIRRSEGGNHV